MELARLLRPEARSRDVVIFNKYVKKQISIDECIELFKKHNQIKRDISHEEFERFLKSLGYYRWQE